MEKDLINQLNDNVVEQLAPFSLRRNKPQIQRQEFPQITSNLNHKPRKPSNFSMSTFLIHTHLPIFNQSHKLFPAKYSTTPRNHKIGKHRPSTSAFRKANNGEINPSKDLAKYEQTRSMSYYVKIGSLGDALQVFDEMPRRDVFAFNVIIRGLVDSGSYEEAIDYYYRMQFEGNKPDYFTYTFVIKACAGLLCVSNGQKAHAQLTKAGFSVDLYVCNSLISMYGNLGFGEYAEILFQEMVIKDLVSWNSMISGYVSIGDGFKAFVYFCGMQEYGIVPDGFSIIAGLGACSLESSPKMGKEIHGQVIKIGLDMNVMVQTALIDMYGKCCELECAEMYFNAIVHKSIGAWNAMIGSYILNGLLLESFACVKKAQNDDKLVPDVITAITLLPAYAQLGSLKQGRSVHGYAIRKGFISHPVLDTALIDMYGKCRRLDLAKIIFSQMTSKTSVSWNVMVSAYVHNENYTEAVQFFQAFLKANLKPDAFFITSVLSAYAEFALKSDCEQIHANIIKSSVLLCTSVSNAVVYMYAKSGELTTAREVFDKISQKDVVSWNAMIMSYALHGFGNDATQIFNEMRENEFRPNASTFVSLLSACSISGMVKEGWIYFNLMKQEYGIDPGIEHYGCMLDLLGRDGNFDMAIRFIEEMPLTPTSRIWGSLLTASRIRKNVDLAEYAAKHILSFDHDNTGCYVLLSSLYSELEMWEDFDRISSIMNRKGIERTVGFSTVEIDRKIYRLLSQDQSHKKTSLAKVTKKSGNLSEFHSVRMGIGLGLISITLGKPVVVRKNIRLCDDCHIAARKMSEIAKREIVVGDSKIFHHFKDGKCSCGDYW